MVELIEKGLKSKSVNRKLAALRTFYKWLRKEELTSSNPMAKVRGPKNEKRLPSFAKESELHPTKLDLVFSEDEKGNGSFNDGEFLSNRNKIKRVNKFKKIRHFFWKNKSFRKKK